MKGSAAICVLMVVAMAHLMVEPSNAIECGDVSRTMGPCVPFLTGADKKPAANCCSGINELKTLVPTTAARRDACECMKAAAAHFQNLDDAAVSSLPAQCGTPVPFPISKNMNCANVP